jgi:hypothetical protein
MTRPADYTITVGEVATTTHWGSYARLPAASAAIAAWCSAHGWRRTGTLWEVYGHWTDDESPLRTDVSICSSFRRRGAVTVRQEQSRRPGRRRHNDRTSGYPTGEPWHE